MPANPDDGARLAARVAEIVAEAEAVLLQRMAAALRTGIDSPDWERLALARLVLLRQQLNRGAGLLELRAAEAIREVIAEAYVQGVALAKVDLAEHGIDLDTVPDLDSTTTTGVLEQAAAAIRQVPNALTQVYQQAVAAGVAEVLGGQVTRVAAAQHVLDRLVLDGISGFRDSAGRNWSLTSYVEMAVRTGAGQTAVQGHVDAIASKGLDLVLVSDSPRECPKCRPWENKVLSLSGRVGAVLEPSRTGGPAVKVEIAGTLDQAKRAGLQHPNCTHSVRAFIPGATKVSPARHDAAGYEAKQRQRAMERKVREWKRREALALDDAAAARARVKVRQWQAELRHHVDAHDLKRLSRREQINVAT